MEHLNHACNDGNDEDIQKAQADMIHTIKSLNIVNQMGRFYERVANKPLTRAIRQYVQMVVEMLIYATPVWTGDWNLHLDATEVFVKYFFVHDKLNYARLAPVYLAYMKTLAQSDAEILEGFMKGNWVLNKNVIPFCAVGQITPWSK